METRQHKGFSHGLEPGTTADINCGECQREDSASKPRTYTVTATLRNASNPPKDIVWSRSKDALGAAYAVTQLLANHAGDDSSVPAAVRTTVAAITVTLD